MPELNYNDFSQQLRDRIPGFDAVYDEHVSDYDEVLPHVLLGDLVRFLVEETEKNGAGSPVLREAMVILEEGMSSADQQLQELVAVSFLENLEPKEPTFRIIASLFGPRLAEQYKRYEDDVM